MSYDLRISDWSSDVCSSDLFLDFVQGLAAEVRGAEHFGFGLLDQIADVDDVVVLEAVGAANRQFELVDLLEQEAVELVDVRLVGGGRRGRSEGPTSELQSLMRSSYAVFCLKKKTQIR